LNKILQSAVSDALLKSALWSIELWIVAWPRLKISDLAVTIYCRHQLSFRAERIVNSEQPLNASTTDR